MTKEQEAAIEKAMREEAARLGVEIEVRRPYLPMFPGDLRDYFATAALTGLLVAVQVETACANVSLAALAAYALADAMLIERAKEKP